MAQKDSFRDTLHERLDKLSEQLDPSLGRSRAGIPGFGRATTGAAKRISRGGFGVPKELARTQQEGDPLLR
jgi:hypothetical protein